MPTSPKRVKEICDIIAQRYERGVLETARLSSLIESVDAVERLKGDIVELGVFDGLTAMVLALTAPNKVVHLFDTFKGITDEALGVNDLPKLKGYFNHRTSEEFVRKIFSDYGNVKIYPGLIEETVPVLEVSSLSFIHFDCDTYGGHVVGLKCLWPKLEVGGCCVFHDYKHPSCIGVTKAVDEFVADRREKPRVIVCGFSLKKQTGLT